MRIRLWCTWPLFHCVLRQVCADLFYLSVPGAGFQNTVDALDGLLATLPSSAERPHNQAENLAARIGEEANRRSTSPLPVGNRPLAAAQAPQHTAVRQPQALFQVSAQRGPTFQPQPQQQRAPAFQAQQQPNPTFQAPQIPQPPQSTVESLLEHRWREQSSVQDHGSPNAAMGRQSFATPQMVARHPQDGMPPLTSGTLEQPQRRAPWAWHQQVASSKANDHEYQFLRKNFTFAPQRHQEQISLLAMPSGSVSGILVIAAAGLIALLVLAMECTASDSWRKLERKDAEPEILDPDLPEEMAPPGNIFRVLSRSAESLKHQEDVHNQLFDLSRADQLESVIEDTKWEDLFLRGEPVPWEPEAQRERNRQKLSRMLWNAIEEKFVEDRRVKFDLKETWEEPAGGEQEFEEHSSCIGLEYLQMLVEAGPTRRILARRFAVPRQRRQMREWLKSRVMVLLIAVTMIASPMIIAVQKITDQRINHIFALQQGSAGSSVNTKEALCIVASDPAPRILGTIFLVIIIEYARAAARNELVANTKMKYLPGDTFWLRVGQFANALCVLFAVLVMPLILWSETEVEGIILDSLGILFVLSLDDLSSKAAVFLNGEAANFQKKYANFIIALETCPVDLAYLVNFDATTHKEVWDLTLWPADQTFDTREDAPPRLIRPPPVKYADDPQKLFIRYWVTPGDEQLLGDGQRQLGIFIKALWEWLSMLLLVAEVALPAVFIFCSRPCHS